MAELIVINERGERQQVSVRRSNVAIVRELDDIEEQIKPAVVERVEYESNPEMSSITTVCGEEEHRNESEGKENLVVEGILTKSQLPDFKNLDKGDRITVLSDIEDETVIIKRLTIEQNTDLVEFIPDDGGAELAFGFQLQLKKP